MFCHCSRNEVAILCGESLNYISAAGEDKVPYIKILTLVVIPENSEDLRCSLDRDDGLEERVRGRKLRN